MHEMSLASSLITQLEQIAIEQNAVRIVEIDLVCGEMQQVVPEAMVLAFEAVAEGTVAEGARLHLSEQRLAAVCRSCGQRYKPEIDNFLCPHCAHADAEIVAGRDIVLQSVVCDTQDEQASP